jgi:hypothetical protein
MSIGANASILSSSFTGNVIMKHDARRGYIYGGGIAINCSRGGTSRDNEWRQCNFQLTYTIFDSNVIQQDGYRRESSDPLTFSGTSINNITTSLHSPSKHSSMSCY